jgi:hypothetical protein
MGVGGIGISLPVLLIFFNWIAGAKVIVPSSMSGSYYTSTRNLFVGSLCALGIFLIGYRHTERQDLCTSFAGVCALAVAFAPTAPSPPKTESAWVNYLHHGAAGALIATLGLFCWVVFAQIVKQDEPQLSAPDGGGTWMRRVGSWAGSAWSSLGQGWRNTLYLICGFLAFAAGILAVYTGVWPASWSTGWPSLYLFEAVAVFAFGAAWISAGWEAAGATEKRAVVTPGASTRSQSS